MAVERTLSIIKPDAVGKNVIGQIISRFEEAGLTVVAAKMLHLSDNLAGGFYAEHKERPFYPDLVKFMTTSPVVVQVLEGEGAIARNRAETHLRTAQVLKAMARPHDAEREFLEAIRCDPTLALYRFEYSDFLLDRERYEEAAQAYQQACAAFHDGTSPRLKAVLARVYDATGDLSLVERFCPPDRRSRGTLKKFLAGLRDNR